MRDELLQPEPLPDDGEGDLVPPHLGEEAGLRPRRLDDFVGQAELKEHLTIILEAARRRGQAADHLLFAGPPGLGKTTLAVIVATEMEVGLHVTSGPALERAGDLASILSQLADGDVLFIDEIHRLARPVEEVLYPAMEDFQLDIVLGKGPAARSIRLDVPRFTLVGATTRTGLITGPLRDRFGLVARLDYYEPADLESIVGRAAGILGVTIDGAGAAEIARRARGTPRIANRLLRRVRDFAEVRGNGTVDHDAARAGLATFGVDERGLDKVDRAILSPALPSASAAARSGCPPWPSAWASPPRPWRTCTSPSSSARACSCAPPGAGSPRPRRGQHLGLTAPPDPTDDQPPPGLFG